MSNISSEIQTFIQLLITHYELEESALVDLWVSSQPKTEKVKEGEKEKEEIVIHIDEVKEVEGEEKKDGKEEVEWESKKVADLKQVCKERGLCLTGKKADLVARLRANPNGVKKETKKEKEEEKPKKGKKKGKSIPSVLLKLESERETLHIRRNTYGLYEHAETGFIFDEQTHKVVGKLKEVLNPHASNVEVEPLTEEDMERCKEMKLEYVLPDTLKE